LGGWGHQHFAGAPHVDARASKLLLEG
jgi:hypothetical protein